MPVDVAAVVARKEERSTGDLVWRACASQWIELANIVFFFCRLRHVEHGFRHASLNQSRANCVDANASSAQLLRTDLNHVDYACFACAVRGRPGARTKACNGSGTDDGASAVVLHVKCGVFDSNEHADQVDVEHLGPVVCGDVEQARHRTGNAGIRVENFEPAEVSNAEIDRGLGRGFVPRRRLDCARFASTGLDGSRGFFDASAIDINADDAGALASEQHRGCASDPASSAGDDRALVFESSHESSSL